MYRRGNSNTTRKIEKIDYSKSLNFTISQYCKKTVRSVCTEIRRTPVELSNDCRELVLQNYIVTGKLTKTKSSDKLTDNLKNIIQPISDPLLEVI